MIYSTYEINRGTTGKDSPFFPRQRGHVKVDNIRFLNALVYICENGCKWRALPETFGTWHAIYLRINRWAKNGVLERIFHALQEEQIMNKRITVVSLDSSSVTVHPDGTRALKKTARRHSGHPAGVLTRRYA